MAESIDASVPVAEAPPAVEAAPAVEVPVAQPAPEVGSTPAAVLAPVPGSTPGTVAQPDVPVTEDASAQALKVAGPDENWAKWIIETNNRAAQLAEEKKLLEDKLKALSTPQAPQPSPAPIQTPQPVAEAVAAPSDQEVEAKAHELTQAAPGIARLRQEHDWIAKSIGQQTPDGAWIPGELGVVPGLGYYHVPELDRRISTIQELVDPERARVAGLPPIDELVRDEYKAVLSNLKAERSARIEQFKEGRERAQALVGYYRSVFDQNRSQLAQSHQAVVEQMQHDQQIADLAAGIEKRWYAELNSTLREAKVEPELVPHISGLIRQATLAADWSEIKDNLPAWMRSQVAGIRGLIDQHHRLRSREYGQGKLQAAGAATSAPQVSSPSPAPPSSQGLSLEQASEINRQRLRSLRGVA